MKTAGKMKDIETMIQQFQAEILAEARKTYGESFFQRWQNPLYIGPLENADTSAKLKGSCGDTIEIYLKFADERVESASFETDGCAPSIVCGSCAAELSIGKDPEELLDLSAMDIINRIGGLPEEVHHCAFLAAETIHSAVNRYMTERINHHNKIEYDK